MLRKTCLLALLLAACSAAEETPAPPPAAKIEPLSPTAHLVRASIVLRGTRPSIDDLRAVKADPSALPGLVDNYLQDASFGETVRDIANEALQVRVDPVIYPAGFPAIGALAGKEVQAINTSLVEAPLRLYEHVVMNDLPLSEIVTADYGMADGTVATVWGMTYDGNGTDWKPARFTDGRPIAGVLSDSMLFTRHATTYSNSNRGRANATSRALLCYDFLTRQIEIDATINLADPKEVASAVSKNAACASCHQTLDPLASYFGSFSPLYVPAQLQRYPVAHWLPALEPLFTVTPPAYFGHKAEGLVSLGRFIAQDPRFSLCQAKRFYAYFNNVRLDEVPLARAAELQKVLVGSGMKGRALARAIILSDDFKASHALTDDVDVGGMKKIRPSQLARLMADLTGFQWETRLDLDIGGGKIGKIDLLRDNLFGFNVLGGGIDAVNVTLPSHTVNASAALVLRGLAARAAPFYVDKEGLAETDEEAVKAKLVELSARFYGELDADVTDAYALFSAALTESNGDAKRAWTVTLFAMLQDARIAFF